MYVCVYVCMWASIYRIKYRIIYRINTRRRATDLVICRVIHLIACRIIYLSTGVAIYSSIYQSIYQLICLRNHLSTYSFWNEAAPRPSDDETASERLFSVRSVWSIAWSRGWLRVRIRFSIYLSSYRPIYESELATLAGTGLRINILWTYGGGMRQYL